MCTFIYFITDRRRALGGLCRYNYYNNNDHEKCAGDR